jgi:PAS domain S-box-containing protein
MTLDGPPRPDYGSVFDAAPGNYLLLDSSFTIVGVNDAYLAATMTVREAILGRGLFEVFPDNPDDPAADGVRNLRASLERVLASKRPDRMPIQKYDIRRPEAEGGGFEERHWSPLNTPVLGPGGEVRYIIHWVEDVTEFIRLKQEMEREQQVMNQELRARSSKIEAEAFLRVEAVEANKRLSESERRYRFLADAVPQLIWTADPTGQAEYFNQRWFSFTGQGLEQLRGDGWQQVLHPEDRERTVALWSQATRSGASRYQIEHRMRHHDGSWRWMLTTALPYRDGKGVIHRWFGATTDIHDRVSAEEQLRHSQRLHALGKLAGGMAHEVNNMMSAVLGFGGLVLEGLGPAHPQRADVDEMVKAGRRASEVTRQLLAFSRQQVLKPMVVDLNAIVGDLAPALQNLIGADRRLEQVLAVSPVRAVADRSQIEQALINLIVNARDATTTDGVILVSTETLHLDEAALQRHHESESEPGWFVRLTVRDNGAGMSPEIAARAFEPFFTTKPVGKGTGLGLSTVHGVAQQSGGFVQLDSAPDAGTMVAIYLPLVQAEVAQAEPVAAIPRGAGETVLVVEDESVVRSLARRVLEEQGYTVYQAPNGAVALEFLSTHPGVVDLVLTDIVMPRMNGRELAKVFTRLHSEARVVFMSGYTDDDVLRRGVSRTGTWYLQKPFSADALARKVREALDAPGDAARARA